MKTIYVGTRGSRLALWQAKSAIDALRKAYPGHLFAIKTYSSAGDIDVEKPLPLMEGKGIFTKALDQALLSREVDIAVHSHKDLPIAPLDPSITTAAVLPRELANDVVVAKRKAELSSLSREAVVGTSSRRRSSQLLAMGRGFLLRDIRGNVETRIGKVMAEDGDFDATVLAYAGLKRLGLLGYASEILDLEQMLPAPAQGSIAVLCLRDEESYALCKAIDHWSSRMCTEAERGFLYGLGGGCSMPIAAHAVIDGKELIARGKVLRPDGEDQVSVKRVFPITMDISVDYAFDMGMDLADAAIARGALGLLKNFEGP